MRGIEPLYEAWEAAVLPLNYTRSGAQFTPSIRGERPVKTPPTDEVNATEEPTGPAAARGSSVPHITWAQKPAPQA